MLRNESVIEFLKEKESEKFSDSTYKVFENSTSEFGTDKYFVCREFVSESTIVGKFNNLNDAEMFCTVKNLDLLYRKGSEC